MNVEGDCGFYYYDEEQSVFTSYFKPYEDKSALEEASKEAANLNSLLKESEEKADQMEIMFLSAAAVATLLLILLIVSLATRKKGSKKVKADRSETTGEIEAEGKTIVYSGDVKSPDELGDWLHGPDVLLMETGHHSAPELCRKFKHEKRKIGKLVFMHHGFEILDHYEETWSRARDIWDGELYFAEDGQTFEL
jgi:ribonuclease BN (tRNA processing enzyme)